MTSELSFKKPCNYITIYKCMDDTEAAIAMIYEVL